MPARFPVSRGCDTSPALRRRCRIRGSKRPRLTVMREVLGRCDGDHLDIGCQPNGDHVLLQALADTDAGVETAGHDVTEAVVDDNVEHSA